MGTGANIRSLFRGRIQANGGLVIYLRYLVPHSYIWCAVCFENADRSNVDRWLSREYTIYKYIRKRTVEIASSESIFRHGQRKLSYAASMLDSETLIIDVRTRAAMTRTLQCPPRSAGCSAACKVICAFICRHA